ncbi:MAG: aminofutalosine synthase MqnE [Spirochaetota bacterium]|nr:aminofutalosine synthase MqnE [Spirochaetota bacterium]
MLSNDLYKSEPRIHKTSSLYPIFHKVKNGTRITESDALTLFETNDIIELGMIANFVKERLSQDKIYYILNGHINYSNICQLRCSFCSFSKSKTDIDAYQLSLEDIKNKFIEYNQRKINEIHIVGGLHPDLPFSFYTNMIKSIKNINPNITVKAFTAVEIFHFSKLLNRSIDDILNDLKSSGLNFLPGGGAEIFNDSIRKKICQNKISAQKWLEVHEIAHNNNIKTNATMLFGHIETYKDRVDHLNQLRNLQDKTNGFLAFIPLTYHPDSNSLTSKRTSAIDELKTISISRIYLDNFPHIKAYWVMLGLKIAQIALNFGADDFDGTVLEEKITHSAGAKSPLMLSVTEIKHLIMESKKIPVERDSFYNEILN